ncbi:MAG: SDR family NAD(P)-dependent oxidoreductase [Halioglobus sp.]
MNLLFNNAGVLVDGKELGAQRAGRWRWILEVNVMGVVNGIRAFVPRMLAQGTPGRIVNTSSIGGLLAGGQFMAPYQGTKHCVTAITESLFRELALEAAPVTASVLCPGEVATEIWRSDRLRAEAERNRLGSETEQAFHDAVAGSVDAGMDPRDFAALVFAGIESDTFWLIPQKALKPLVQARYQGIEDESNPLPLT